MFGETGLTVTLTEQVVKRHALLDWAQRQGCSPEVIEQLIAMMQQAPTIAADWMQPQAWGTHGATFVNHHIIIAGRKKGQ